MTDVRELILGKDSEGNTVSVDITSHGARYAINPSHDPIAELAFDVMHRGSQVASRYGPCFEILGGRVDVPCGILIARRGINYSIGWMEMLQLLAGVFDIEALVRVAPNADQSLFTEKMAYGPRIHPELWWITEALRRDQTTRQAVLFIGKPWDGPSPDLPCTLTVQFLIRGGEVHAIVTMRSWDLCRGLPYDLMMFSSLLMTVARSLDLPYGRVIVTAGSTHIYEEWMDRLPYLSSTRWVFDESVSTNSVELKRWAREQVQSLEKGEVPEGIELIGTP